MFERVQTSRFVIQHSVKVVEKFLLYSLYSLEASLMTIINYPNIPCHEHTQNCSKWNPNAAHRTTSPTLRDGSCSRNSKNYSVGIKNCKQLFSLRLAFTTEKKVTLTAVIMSVLCVAIFWVIKASSCEKSCSQFSIPTGFGAAGEGDVSHRLNTVSAQLMYTCNVRLILVRLNSRRFIVGASPELKFRTTDEADTAHVVSSYRQLATRDIFFLPTSFKLPHSLRPMRARDTAYFESYATDVFITPCLLPFCQRVLANQK